MKLNLDEMIQKTQEIADSNLVAAENYCEAGMHNYEMHCRETSYFYEDMNEYLRELKRYREEKTK